MKKNIKMVGGFAKIISDKDLSIITADECFYRIFSKEDEKVLSDVKSLTILISDEMTSEIKKKIHEEKQRLFVIKDSKNNISLQFEQLQEDEENKVFIVIARQRNNDFLLIEKVKKSEYEIKKMRNSVPGYFGKVALLEKSLYILSGNDQFCYVLNIAPKDNELDNNGEKKCSKDKISYKEIGIKEDYVNEILAKSKHTFFLEYERIKFDIVKNFLITGTLYEEEKYKDKYPIYFIYVMDITLQKESKSQAFIQQEKYKIITDLSEDIVFEYDCKLDVLEFSDNYNKLFGKTTFINNLRKDIENGINNPNLIKIDYIKMLDYIQKKKAKYQTECCLRTTDDNCKWMYLNAVGVKDKEGKIVKILGIIKDIDKQKKEENNRNDKSRIDSLTGALNKIAIKEDIMLKLSNLQEGAYGILMMIDIDFLKEINDTFGHMMGDYVLKEVVSSIKSTFRSEDIVGRIGGDEFLVYVNNTMDVSIAKEKAIRLNECIVNTFRNTEVEKFVSVSIGIAFASSDNTSYKDLYQKADMALYNAKENGKRKYAIYGKSDKKSDELSKNKKRENGFSNVDYDAIKKIIESVYTTGDFIDNIDEVFEYLEEIIHFSKVNIFTTSKKKNKDTENGSNEECVKVIYEWSKKGDNKIKPYEKNATIEHFVVLQDDDTNGFYYCKNISELDTNKRVYFAKRGVVSLIQIKVYDEKGEKTYIEFLSDSENEWNKKEFGLLKILTTMLSQTVLKDSTRNLSGEISLATKAKQYGYVLKERCEQIIELNVYTGNFNLYLPCQEGFSDYSNRSNYNDWVADKIIPYLSQEHCDKYLDNFLLESMQKRFATGMKNIVMEYKKELENEERWLLQTAVELVENNRKKILLYTFDITEKKEREEKVDFLTSRLEGQDNVMKYLCEEILELDLNKKEARLIFKKDDAICNISVDGNIFDNLVEYREKFVDKKDKKNFSKFLSGEGLKRMIKQQKDEVSFNYLTINHSNIDTMIKVIITRKKNSNVVYIVFKEDNMAGLE